MTTLMIKDLALTEQLDRKAMAAVHGGMLTAYVPYWVPGYSESTSSFEASQVIGQVQNIVNQNGNNVAFASGIQSTINPSQTASNNINHF